MIYIDREYWACLSMIIMPVKVIARTEPVTDYFVYTVEYRDSNNQKKTATLSARYIFTDPLKAAHFCDRQADYYASKADGFRAMIELDEELNPEEIQQQNEEWASAQEDESSIKLSRE